MTNISGLSPYMGAAAYSSTASKKSSSVQTGSSTSSADADAIAKFMAYQKMTPEQKLRDAILKKLGMTEDQLKMMTPATRNKVEEEIKAEMEKMVKGNLAEKGILVDMSA